MTAPCGPRSHHPTPQPLAVPALPSVILSSTAQPSSSSSSPMAGGSLGPAARLRAAPVTWRLRPGRELPGAASGPSRAPAPPPSSPPRGLSQALERDSAGLRASRQGRTLFCRRTGWASGLCAPLRASMRPSWGPRNAPWEPWWRPWITWSPSWEDAPLPLCPGICAEASGAGTPEPAPRRGPTRAL